MTNSTPPASTSSRSPLLADLSLLGVALIWGINLPVMKIGLEQIDVYAFNAFRLAISTLVLVIIALCNKPQSFFRMPRSTQRLVLQYAVIASGLYQVLFLLGLANTTSGNASLILATVPMWTALLALIFLGERLAGQAWLGLLVALSGTLIVTGQNGMSGDRSYLLGNLIMLAGALAWATATVTSRRVLREVSPLTLSALASLLMLPLHFAIAAPILRESIPLLTQPAVWLTLLYSGIFSTGLALPMWNYGVREAGAAHAAVIQNLVPAIALVSAWLIRGEPIRLGQVIGGSLIIGGLVLMRRARLRLAPQLPAITPASSPNVSVASDQDADMLPEHPREQFPETAKTAEAI